MRITSIKEINNVLARSDRKLLLMFIPLFVINVLLEGLSIGLVVPLISALTNVDSLRKYASFLMDVSDFNMGQIQLAAIVLFGLMFLFKSGYSLFIFYFVESVYMKIRYKLHTQMYNSYLKASLLFHKACNSSELKRNVDEIGTVFQQHLSPLVLLISESLVVLGLVAILLYVDFVLSLISFVFISLIVLIVYSLIKPKLHELGGVRVEAAEKTNRHMLQGFFAITEIKSNSKENYFADKFSSYMNVFLRSNLLNAFYNQVSSVLVEALFVFGILAILLVMVYQGGDSKTILPVLALFALTSMRIMSSVKKITACLNQIAYSRKSLSIVSSEIDYLKENGLWQEKQHKKTGVDAQFVKKLGLNGLYFKYPKATESALKDVNINISKGECIGIVGHSGSGKTTLINILLGLLKPTEGNYFIDDRQNVDIDNVNHLIGYVPQKIYILDDTVLNNVAFGCRPDEVDDVRVVTALKMAHAYDVMKNLPDGLDTILGENGASLSGGQIQRIGIARALYDDPEILIFDEATSSLDNKTEFIINSEIESLSNLKTIIVVAHRLSSVKRCDRIYYMDGGSIKAVGTFSELYDKTIAFKELVDAGSLD